MKTGPDQSYFNNGYLFPPSMYFVRAFSLFFQCFGIGGGIKIQEGNVFGYAWEMHIGVYAWTVVETAFMLIVQLV